MAEYSRLARGSFTSTGNTQTIYLPFMPNIIKMTNFTAAGTPANHGIPFAQWDSSMAQGTAVANLFNATPVLTTGNVASGGFTTFSAGLMFQFGAQQQITGATAANPIVFTVTAHGYSTGDWVMFEGLYQSSTTGMPQISSMPFQITVTDANTFSVVWPGAGSNYTALSGSPAGAYVKKILYPALYAPGVSFIEAITTGATTTVVTTTPHNLSVGSEVAFRIPPQWGTTQLNSLPNATIPGAPKYNHVISVTNSTTFVVNANSTSYTAFNTNIAVTAVPGLTPAQVIAVGDVNSGGQTISAGSVFYPSPVVNGVSTINGPAINGAFINNTRQGFMIGTGSAGSDSSSVLVGANTNVIFWEAVLTDISY